MTTIPDDPCLALARQTVGAVTIVTDRALHRRVLHLADNHGTHYFAKRHDHPARFQQEIGAYRHWTRHLPAQTPELIAHQSESQTLLLTAVPGAPADSLPTNSETEKRAHRAAGIALRALHDATTAAPARLGADIGDRLSHWLDRATQLALLSSAEHRTLHTHHRQLALQRMESAICHLDYQPRNWCVGPAFAVIDFEHTRRDARIRDLARLAHRYWPSSPHLREAFLDGYGRLSDEEENLLHHFAAYEAVTALVRGHETGDATLTQHGRATLALLLP